MIFPKSEELRASGITKAEFFEDEWGEKSMCQFHTSMLSYVYQTTLKTFQITVVIQYSYISLDVFFSPSPFCFSSPCLSKATFETPVYCSIIR